MSEEKERFWAYVTAFGALWGSMEITLGSFLHVLRFPFAGILLASLSAALLVAQRQLMPRRGITLATGVVAALCKSISPGGVILGPMIGIITESLLVELALLVAPRALLPALVGGALCALWSGFQGLVTQYVIYGARIVDLYLAALGKAGDWLGIPPRVGWWALAVLVGVICLMGAVGALLGRRVGNASRARILGEVGQ
jgi:hypothetical protein